MCSTLVVSLHRWLSHDLYYTSEPLKPLHGSVGIRYQLICPLKFASFYCPEQGSFDPSNLTGNKLPFKLVVQYLALAHVGTSWHCESAAKYTFLVPVVSVGRKGGEIWIIVFGIRWVPDRGT